MTRRAACVLIAALMLGTIVLVVGCPKKAEKTAETPVAKAPGEGGPAPMAETPPAETGAPPEAAQPSTAGVTITAEKMKNWIACMEVLDKEVPELKKMGGEPEPGKAPDWARMKKDLDAAADNPKVQAVVKKHGFADGKEWAAFTGKVLAGMTQMAAQMGAEMAKSLGGGEKSAELKKAQAEMGKMTKGVEEAFGKISDAEMKTLMKAMEETGKAMGEKPAKAHH